MIWPVLVVVATIAAGNHQTIPVVCNVKADPGVEGYAILETGVVHLRPEWCDSLRGVTPDGYAALVLGHELGHVVLQTSDEHRAECWGLTHVKAIARLLGWNTRVAFSEARHRSFC